MPHCKHTRYIISKRRYAAGIAGTRTRPVRVCLDCPHHRTATPAEIQAWLLKRVHQSSANPNRTLQTGVHAK